MIETRPQPLTAFTLEDKYTREEGVIYLSGIQALVRLLLDRQRADRRRGLHTGTFVSGYPGSPVGTLDLELNRQVDLLRWHDIHFVPGLNEDLAATAVFGSQLMGSLPGQKFDGAVGMWFGKSPGVDRSGDAFRHGNFRGIAGNGGVLAVAGDDPQARSSTVPSDSTTAFYDLLMPLVYPGDVQEVIDLGLHAFMLSRVAGLGVGFKFVYDVADSSGTALVAPDRIVPVVPDLEIDGRLFRPSFRPNDAGRVTIEAERMLHEGRLELARAYARENGLNRTVGSPGAGKLGFIVAGKTYFDLLEAMRQLGLDVKHQGRHDIRILKLGMLFPFDAAAVRDFARGLDEIVVIEEKRPFVELFVKDALFGLSSRPRVLGKNDDQDRALVPVQGELSPELVERVVASRLEATTGQKLGKSASQPRELVQIQSAPPRRAYFCSGCPHSSSLTTPEGSIVGAGIGCHTLALQMNREQFSTVVGFTHMGAEGAQWVGVSPFTDTPHFFQNLGDGTLFHSGTLAIRFAVASGSNVTYKILYNSAVGMTGGQNVTGSLSVPELARLLVAERVRRIAITSDDPDKYRGVELPAAASVHHRDDLLEVEQELAKQPGVTVLIHDQYCAAEKRRLRKRGKLAEGSLAVYINERVCEGCGDCGQTSNCLSVQPVDTEFGRKTQIHQSSCNADYTCLNGDCPSFLTIEMAQPAANKTRSAAKLPDIALPQPEPLVPIDSFNVHMSGIGGTGVITVNQVLGTAAVLAGRYVRGMDQTGSSQKAGPVVSHLKISSRPIEQSNSVVSGDADVILAFDLLVAADPQNRRRADPAKTVAIISTSQVPTGAMIVDPTVQFPEADLLGAIAACTRANENVHLDVQAIADHLLGDSIFANMILVGAAYQRGALPLPLEAIEQAIKLNGALVEMNLSAFRWGRLAVARPELVELAVHRSVLPTPPPSAELDRSIHALVDWAGGELRRLLDIRTADLAGYQDLSYARSYAEFVKQVAQAEGAAIPGASRFAEAVAFYLHKLMAYKDEYEVARLHLDAAARAAVRQEFGERVKVRWHLHPPFLRALGLRSKIVLGAWFSPAFRMLRALKWLRGTPFDFFSYSEMRRIERQLIVQYRAVIEALLTKLSADTYEQAVEIARLPDTLRGYESIKLNNVRRYQARLGELSEVLGVRVPALGAPAKP